MYGVVRVHHMVSAFAVLQCLFVLVFIISLFDHERGVHQEVISKDTKNIGCLGVVELACDAAARWQRIQHVWKVEHTCCGKQVSLCHPGRQRHVCTCMHG